MATTRLSSLASPRRIAGAVLASCLAATSGAAADTPGADPRAGYEVRAHAAMNPGSLSLGGDLWYRRPLYAAEGALLGHNEWMLQAGARISPASLTPSVRLSIQPLSVLRLWAQYEGEGFFGTSSFARSFPSPASDYGRGFFSPPPPGPAGATGPYPLWVNRFELGVRPQVEVGHFVARSAWRAVRYEANLHGGDRVLYDPWIDHVVYAHGWAVQSDSDLGYQLSPGGPLLGARFSLVLVFYPSAAYPANQAHDTLDSPTARLGPHVRWPLLKPSDTRPVRQLFITGLTQWYLADRFHQGATTPAAAPMVSLSLTATGDL